MRKRSAVIPFRRQPTAKEIIGQEDLDYLETGAKAALALSDLLLQRQEALIQRLTRGTRETDASAVCQKELRGAETSLRVARSALEIASEIFKQLRAPQKLGDSHHA